MCSPRLLCGLVAGCAVYAALSSHSAVVDDAVARALSNQPELPADAFPIALTVAHILPAVIAVLLVLLIFGAAEVIFCSCCTASGTTYRSESHVPMGLPVVSTQEYHELPHAASGSWSDGLCSCFNDMKLLAAGACCLPVVVGQLFERVKRQPYACALIVACVVAASLFVSGVQASCPDAIPKVECTSSGGTVRCSAREASPQVHVPAYCSLADGVSSLTWLVLVGLVMTVRASVRALYRIPPSCCGQCDDCCFSFCCLPLEAIRIMRHLNANDWNSSYKFMSATGEGSAGGARVVMATAV